MKRILIAFSAISFLFFSCASNSALPETTVTQAVEEAEGNPSDDTSSETVETEYESGDGDLSQNESTSEEEETSPNEENNAEDEIVLEEIPSDEGEFITEVPKEEVKEPEKKVTVPEIPAIDVEVPILKPQVPEVTQTEESESENSDESENTEIAEDSENENETQPSEEDDLYFTGVDINPAGESPVLAEQKTNTPQAKTKSPEKKNSVTPKPATPKASENKTGSSNTKEESSAPVSESFAEENISEPAKEEAVIPSRKVSMKNNQYLDVQYPGSGWVYLGEVNDSQKIRYFGRKVGSGDTTFSLRSREEGNTILHFYKNDALTGEYIDDYLEVDIKGKSNDSSRAKAPLYAEVVPPKPAKKNQALAKNDLSETEAEESSANSNSSKESSLQSNNPSSAQAKGNSSGTRDNSNQSDTNGKTENAQNDSSASQGRGYSEGGTSTVIQNTTSQGTASQDSPAPRTQEDSQTPAAKKSEDQKKNTDVSIQDTSSLSEDEILSLAQESFDSKEFSKTLAYLNSFFEKAVSRVDEGLYLQGQVYESNSSVRNIRSALDTYETIVRRYPQSIHWAKANERIIYLRRFYINIR